MRSGFKALLTAAGMTEEEFVRQHLRVQTKPRRAAEEGQPPATAGLPAASRGRRTVPPREQSEAPEEARARGPTPRRTPSPHSVAHPGSGSSSGSGSGSDSDSDEAVDGPAHHTIAESVKMAAGAASTSKPPAPTRAVAAVSPAPAAPISKEKRKVRPLLYLFAQVPFESKHALALHNHSQADVRGRLQRKLTERSLGREAARSQSEPPASPAAAAPSKTVITGSRSATIRARLMRKAEAGAVGEGPESPRGAAVRARLVGKMMNGSGRASESQERADRIRMRLEETRTPSAGQRDEPQPGAADAIRRRLNEAAEARVAGSS